MHCLPFCCLAVAIEELLPICLSRPFTCDKEYLDQSKFYPLPSFLTKRGAGGEGGSGAGVTGENIKAGDVCPSDPHHTHLAVVSYTVITVIMSTT